jgi:hypothetical protein
MSPSTIQVAIASVVDGVPAARVVIPAARKPFDAHLAVSLGLDLDSRLDVAYGALDSLMQIARTNGPGLARGFLRRIENGTGT